MPEIPTFDMATPVFDETMAIYGPRLDESPWSPEFLEAPWPATITAAIDVIKRDIALVTPTQLMAVIGDGDRG